MKARVIVPPVPLIVRVSMSGVLIWIARLSLNAAAWVTPEIPQ